MDPVFPQPHPVQLRGSKLAQWILQALGWKVRFDGLPTLQGMFVVYPHTSNWDFVMGVLAKWSLGVQVNFWGKGSLFEVPILGRWLRWLGGIPVLRDAPQGLVGQAVQQLQQARDAGRYCWFALAPEGTRKYTAGWRSGFYRTAVQAGVPACLVRLDFGAKVLEATRFMNLSGDAALDMYRIARCFEGVRGYHPSQAAPVRLLAGQGKAAQPAGGDA